MLTVLPSPHSAFDQVIECPGQQHSSCISGSHQSPIIAGHSRGVSSEQLLLSGWEALHTCLTYIRKGLIVSRARPTQSACCLPGIGWPRLQRVWGREMQMGVLGGRDISSWLFSTLGKHRQVQLLVCIWFFCFKARASCVGWGVYHRHPSEMGQVLESLWTLCASMINTASVKTVQICFRELLIFCTSMVLDQFTLNVGKGLFLKKGTEGKCYDMIVFIYVEWCQRSW